MLSFLIVFKLIGQRDKVKDGLKRSKVSWYSKLLNIVQRANIEESIWEDLEEMLVLGDVGISTANDLIEELKFEVSNRTIRETQQVIDSLKQKLVSILSSGRENNFQSRDNTKGPLVILIVGVNGVGKTTSIGKLAHYFKGQGKDVLFAASDTFRAAAIEQLQVWGQRVGADVIAHKSGGDPAAVAYDALEAAYARSKDVLIVDTAGRLHTTHNLMEEVKKISRVMSRIDTNAPDEVILVLDATTGQNGLIQARSFAEAVGCTGVFLSKIDGTAKGGVVIPIVKELGIPILFIGTGENMDDMTPFDPAQFVDELFSAD
jgi:fused signal recognition particle receptor